MQNQTDTIINSFTKELRDSLGEKISGIYLFGSVAKGLSTPESDIDVLYIQE